MRQSHYYDLSYVGGSESLELESLQFVAYLLLVNAQIDDMFGYY